MTQYIDKDALVAEIEGRLEAQQYELINLAQYINTLEVKEVDLDEEIERFVKSDEFRKASGTIKVTNLLAKHFYELGLKAQKGE